MKSEKHNHTASCKKIVVIVDENKDKDPNLPNATNAKKIGFAREMAKRKRIDKTNQGYQISESTYQLLSSMT